MLDDRFLSIAETRKFAGDISARTVYRWSERGEFPKPYRIGPNRVGWLQSELQEWLLNKKEVRQYPDTPEAA